MRIENLNKDLDTEAQKAVTGGTALTGQVVPTSVQSNELLQKFNVGAGGPVALGNDATQDNYSSQDTVSPVGSVILGPDFLRQA